MRVLIAEDDAVSRRLLEVLLQKWGYEVRVASTGLEALKRFEAEPDIQMAIVDWMMPEMDGVQLCRRLRSQELPGYLYFILLTAKGRKDDVVAGLEAGADDYVTKPFDARELKCRVDVGARIVELEAKLAQRVGELQSALAHVQRLQGIIPICMYCRRVRDEREAWQKIESYLEDHSEAQFSHGICAECMKEHHSR